MKSGAKCAAPPAPSPCDAPLRSSPARSSRSCSSLNPAFAEPSCARTPLRMNGIIDACRFWLTFSVTFASSVSGGDTCSATRFSGV